MIDKEHILAEIRRTAVENGSQPLGRDRFAVETGIKESDWSGRHWARWGDALLEAGYQPNRMTPRFEDDAILARLVPEVRRLGRLPTNDELRMLRRADPTLPSLTVFARYGPKHGLAAKLVEYCAERADLADVAELVLPLIGDEPVDDAAAPDSVEFGFVYLLRSGRNYKLGRSNAFGRRERELAIQLPERAGTVHVIRTDDPAGIEAYWHRRFADRRGNGEWFRLTADDVAAFRRRKFM